MSKSSKIKNLIILIISLIILIVFLFLSIEFTKDSETWEIEAGDLIGIQIWDNKLPISTKDIEIKITNIMNKLHKGYYLCKASFEGKIRIPNLFWPFNINL